MNIDKRMLDRILTMDDTQLSTLVQNIAKEAGIDPAQLGMQADNIQSIRHALSIATDSDMEQLSRVYDDYRKNRYRR